MPVPRVEKYPSSPRGFECVDHVPHGAGLARHDRRDQEFLLEVRTGSSAAFEELQKLYSNRLYKRILSITRNHEDAEDALQDTFMRAFLAFDSFQGRSHISRWLTRIAINSALMAIRRRRRAYAEVSLTARPKPEADFREFDIRDSAPTPEESHWNHWEKRGEWNLNVYKQGSRWGFFMKNPKGGGGGSGSYPTMGAAIAAGIRVGWTSPHINPEKKTRYWFTVLQWDADKEDWTAKKSEWKDVPKEMLSK